MAGLVSSPPFRSMVTVGTEVQLCLLGRLMFVCSVDLASGYEKKKKRSEIITSSLEKSDQATLRLFCLPTTMPTPRPISHTHSNGRSCVVTFREERFSQSRYGIRLFIGYQGREDECDEHFIIIRHFPLILISL
jgi:hypothetical protein